MTKLYAPCRFNPCGQSGHWRHTLSCVSDNTEAKYENKTMKHEGYEQSTSEGRKLLGHSPTLKLIFSLFPIFQRMPGLSCAGAIITKCHIPGDWKNRKHVTVLGLQVWDHVSAGLAASEVSLHPYTVSLCMYLHPNFWLGPPNDLILTYSLPFRLHLKIQTHPGA